jgi:putative DNA primase/helicase
MKNQKQPRRPRVNRRKSLLAAALHYAEQGVPVFPVHSVRTDGSCTCGRGNCGSVGKHPHTRNGHKDATTDRDQIRRWWSKKAWNIGAVPGHAGFAVVDVDPWKDGEEDRVERIEQDYGPLPPTFTVLTGQHGDERGRHRWYRVPEGTLLPRKFEGVDVRSGEAYVLMPPSRHQSGIEYEVETGDLANAADGPSWLLDQTTTASSSPLSNAAERTGLKLGKRTKVAIRDNVLPPPEDGESHRDVAVGIARNLHEDGNSPEVVDALITRMLDDPASSLDPNRPWTTADAKAIVRSVTSQPAPDHDRLANRSMTVARRKILTLEDALIEAEKPIDWIIPELLAKGEKAVVAGPPKSYKTWFLLHLARCITCAEPVFRQEKWKPQAPQGILIIEEEGAHQRWGRRLKAVFEGQTNVPLFYCHRSGLNLGSDEDAEWVISEVRRTGVSVVFIDPLQRVYGGVKENDATETGPAWDRIHQIASETNAAVVVLHHTNKSSKELSQEAIRGSSRVAGEVDLMTIQHPVAKGRLEMKIDGRDLDLNGFDDRMYIEMDSESPHMMRLLGMKVLPHERAGSLGQLALEVLESADGWMSTAEILDAITPRRDRAPTKAGVENALKKLEADGRVESCKRGPKHALHWQEVL